MGRGGCLPLPEGRGNPYAIALPRKAGETICLARPGRYRDHPPMLRPEQAMKMQGKRTMSSPTQRSVLAGAAAGVALAPFVRRSGAAETRTLYVNSWGGSWTTAQDEAFYKPFTAATGIRIR